MERWNHQPEEESQRDGQENDDTTLLVTRNEGVDSLEQLNSSSSSTHPSTEQCEECSFIKNAIKHSPESSIFWHMIRIGPSAGGCHKKYMDHFLTAMKDHANDLCLHDDKTIALLKRLLRVDEKDVTASVEFSNFARLVQYFGPIRENDCIMVKQINNIVQKSSVFTNRDRKETVSWFAGDMTRDAAESLLSSQLNGTYLVRMSQTSPGYFVVSVTSEDTVYHIIIEADVTKALRSDPYNANLHLHGLVYPSLVDAAHSLKSRILETEDGLEIMCRKYCPNLPINAIISGYRRSAANRR